MHYACAGKHKRCFIPYILMSNLLHVRVHTCLQVDQMVAYAVGEMTRQLPTIEECVADERASDEIGGGGGGSSSSGSSSSSSGGVSREQSSTVARHRKPRTVTSCYEVVTAWVHPR